MPKHIDIDTLEWRKRELGKYLKIYIEQVVAEASRTIKEKGGMQRYLGLPPDMENLRESIFFKGKFAHAEIIMMNCNRLVFMKPMIRLKLTLN